MWLLFQPVIASCHAIELLNVSCAVEDGARFHLLEMRQYLLADGGHAFCLALATLLHRDCS